MLFREARKKDPYFVVPEDYDSVNGWQHIWRDAASRSHLTWLASAYNRRTVERWVSEGVVRRYPLPRKTSKETTPSSVTRVDENYVRPGNEIINGEAIVEWLKVYANDPTKWPTGTYRYQYQFKDATDLEWAIKKVYYMQRGSAYGVKTGRYEFRCCASDFVTWLRNAAWLPSTKGPVSPLKPFFPGRRPRRYLAIPYRILWVNCLNISSRCSAFKPR